MFPGGRSSPILEGCVGLHTYQLIFVHFGMYTLRKLAPSFCTILFRIAYIYHPRTAVHHTQHSFFCDLCLLSLLVYLVWFTVVWWEQPSLCL